MSVKLVDLPRATLMDIPLQLRRLADRLEADVLADPEETARHVIVVIEHDNGTVETCGFGEIGTRLTEVGLLEYAKADMIIGGRRPLIGPDAA